MSKWNIIEAAQYHRDLKKMLKKYPRETGQMLVNLVRYRDALERNDNPLLLVQFPFVHRETSGCHALTQQPLSSAAQTRLYLYCHIDEHNLHLLLRQLKNIALTKRQIEIWRLFASASERKISPGRGVRTLAGGKSASALAAPGILEKYRSPGGVTESTASVYFIAFCHPSGAPFNLSHSGGCARKAGLPPASVLSPTSWAQNSSGFQPDKFQFIV